MNASAEKKSATGPLLEVLGPGLIIVMIVSLVWFLIEVFYRGPHQARLCWVLGLFSAASVLVSRISVESGRERSWIFAVPLAAATLFVSLSLIQGTVLFPFMMVGFIAFVLWAADRLTWDCTVIDNSRDASAVGLVEMARRKFLRAQTKAQDLDVAASADVTIDIDEGSISKSSEADDKSQSGNLFWALLGFSKGRNLPGLWSFYFAIGSLLLFGLGQPFVAADTEWGYLWVSTLFGLFLASSLSLLTLTSLFGLQRYLQKRQIEVPELLPVRWLTVGITAALLVAAITMMVPRPNLPGRFENAVAWLTSRDRAPSKVAFGKDGVQEGANPNSATQNPKPAGADSKSNPQSNKPESQNQSGQSNPQSTGSPNSQPGKGPKGGESGPGQQSGGSQPGGKSGGGEKGGDKGGEKSSGNQQNNDPKNSSQQNTNNGQEPQPGQQNSGQQQQSQQQGGEKSEQGSKSETSSQSGSESQQEEKSSDSSDPSKGVQDKPENESGKNQNPDSGKNQAQNTPQNNSGNKAPDQNAVQQPPKNSGAGNPPPAQNQAPNQSSPQNNGQVSKFAGQMAKWLVILIGLLAMAVLAWMFRDELAKFWAELQAWLNGTDSKAAARDSSVRPRPSSVRVKRSFVELQNPFREGTAGSIELSELTQQTFEAMETLAAETGVPRDPDWTVHEFAGSIAVRHKSLGNAARELDAVYSEVAYGGTDFAGQEALSQYRNRLGQIWQAMERFYNSPDRKSVATSRESIQAS